MKSFEADKTALRRRVAGIDTEMKRLLDLILKTDNVLTISSYEKRIDELSAEQATLKERLATEQATSMSFADMFELSLQFLQNP